MACLFVVGSIAYFSGAALYVFAKNRVRKARILKSVIRVEKLYLKNEDVTVRQKEKCNCAGNHQKTCNVAWTLHSQFISSIPKEVPWYLDDGTDRVYVVGARFATDFAYPAVRSKFDESGQTLVDGHFQDIKASKDDDGTIRIQQPPKGPFYVSHKMIDEHIANFEGSARWCKHISVGLTTIGASLIAKNAIGR
ncbi:hypothetical protein TSUD_39390 [Trifolium subterraneum]|uniref:RING-type E3 ubiquitin transferase n=1 Tax=Trifolium subterraneum TaxID=3900 RepID=A0A2Z6N3Z1_TRISU|nr:hypothetical protein TSUD_39390 [Trifolium subterraneum]